MSRVLNCGFELNDLVGWATSGAPQMETTIKRSGSACVKLGTSTVSSPTFGTKTEAFFRIGAYWTGGGDDFKVNWRQGSSTVEGSIRMNGIGQLLIYVGTNLKATGTLMLAKNAWYLIEIHVKEHASTGLVEVRVDGNDPDVSWSGNTIVGAGTFDNILLEHNSATGSIYYDDIAVNDTAGGVDDSWCGDGHYTKMIPDGAPTKALTPTSGTDNYDMVDEFPADGDTTYVEGSVVDTEDVYSLTACGLTAVNITRIFTEARARDTVAAGGKIALTTQASGGAIVSGGDVSLLTTYTKRVLGAEQKTNPVDSQAWEVADLDALKAGIRVRG